jgi:hypothetical protein
MIISVTLHEYLHEFLSELQDERSKHLTDQEHFFEQI